MQRVLQLLECIRSSGLFPSNVCNRFLQNAGGGLPDGDIPSLVLQYGPARWVAQFSHRLGSGAWRG
jgi:hypothetical protein